MISSVGIVDAKPDKRFHQKVACGVWKVERLALARHEFHGQVNKWTFTLVGKRCRVSRYLVQHTVRRSSSPIEALPTNTRVQIHWSWPHVCRGQHAQGSDIASPGHNVHDRERDLDSWLYKNKFLPNRPDKSAYRDRQRDSAY
jgi:hypothetical protein